MLKNRRFISTLCAIGMCTSLVVGIKSTPFIAEQSIEMDSVEFKNFRKDTYVKMQELKETRNTKNITEDVVEEVEVTKMMVEEEYEVYPSYNPHNLLEPSNITTDQAYELLEGSNLQGLARGYTYIEELYGINALWLMALSIEESGYGWSSLAITNNNIGGIKDKYGGWAVFNDFYDCLSYKADLLYNEYLSEDGLYFNGYSIYDVNIKYCEGDQWSENINAIAYDLLSKIN